MSEIQMCGGCAFFTSTNKTTSPVDWGVCRRYPKQYAGPRVSDPAKKDWSQPYVCERDWCGKFKPREAGR